MCIKWSHSCVCMCACVLLFSFLVCTEDQIRHSTCKVRTSEENCKFGLVLTTLKDLLRVREVQMLRVKTEG